MPRVIDITPSELVLSAIFFLQQKNGVTEKEITRYISKKVGCKPSAVSKEVKEALDKAIENGIFTKKQGLYRIESSLGSDLKSIKKMAKDTIKDEELDLQEDLQSHYQCHDNMEDRWLHSQSSRSDRISLDQLDVLKSKGFDDDDDEDDFLEDEDDELDFFDDDQFSDAFSLKKESPPPVKSNCSKKRHRRRGNKSKSGGPKSKRKSMRPRKRMMKRKKQLMCTCKSSDYSSRPPVKSSRRNKSGNEVYTKGENSRGGHRKQNKQKHKTDETDKNCEANKRGKKGKKVKESNPQYGGTRFCKECNCNTKQEAKKDVQTQDQPDETKAAIAQEDQAKKIPKEEQLKRKGKEASNKDEKDVSKKTEDPSTKKDTKVPPPVVKAGNPSDVPPEREWRRKKAKRERSSSLFRPIKKKVSSKDKTLLEQKSAKNKTTK